MDQDTAYAKVIQGDSMDQDGYDVYVHGAYVHVHLYIMGQEDSMDEDRFIRFGFCSSSKRLSQMLSHMWLAVSH